jgi:hypothetical protein
MRVLLCTTGLLAATFAVAPAEPGADAKTAEVRWAKQVVAEFIDLAAAGEDAASSTPLALLHPELAARERDVKESGGRSMVGTLRSYYPRAKWTVENEEVAPNGSEVVLIGRLEERVEAGENRRPRSGPAVFRVSKDTEGGRWRITVIRFPKLPNLGG